MGDIITKGEGNATYSKYAEGILGGRSQLRKQGVKYAAKQDKKQ